MCDSNKVKNASIKRIYFYYSKSRYVMKENRIPIGKKREAIEKKEASLKSKNKNIY